MPRRQVALYDGVKIPRTTENERKLWLTKHPAKKHPKYVHGKIGQASLLHKIAYVDMRWYDYNYEYLLRLQSPILTAHTICGMIWRLEAGKAGTCEVPKPDAVMCGRCHGEGVNFPRNREPKIPMKLAKVRLGCVAQGESL